MWVVRNWTSTICTQFQLMQNSELFADHSFQMQIRQFTANQSSIEMEQIQVIRLPDSWVAHNFNWCRNPNCLPATPFKCRFGNELQFRVQIKCTRCKWPAIRKAGFAHNFNWCKNLNCSQAFHCNLLCERSETVGGKTVMWFSKKHFHQTTSLRFRWNPFHYSSVPFLLCDFVLCNFDLFTSVGSQNDSIKSKMTEKKWNGIKYIDFHEWHFRAQLRISSGQNPLRSERQRRSWWHHPWHDCS